jgi:hypothetical protein
LRTFVFYISDCHAGSFSPTRPVLVFVLLLLRVRAILDHARDQPTELKVVPGRPIIIPREVVLCVLAQATLRNGVSPLQLLGWMLSKLLPAVFLEH